MHWGDARGLNYPPPDVNVDVSAVAEAPTITVFVKVDHNRAVPNSMIFLDAVSLFVDPVQPPPTAYLRSCGYFVDRNCVAQAGGPPRARKDGHADRHG